MYFNFFVHQVTFLFVENSMIVPQKLFLNIGQNGSIHCLTNSTAKWTREWWEKMPHNVDIHTNTLLIKNVEMENKGVYYCQGTTESGLTFFAAVTVKIRSMIFI